MRRPSGTKIPHRSWEEGRGGRGVRGREKGGEGEVTEVGIVSMLLTLIHSSGAGRGRERGGGGGDERG